MATHAMRRLTLCLALLALTLGAQAASSFAGIERIVAVGDVHGDFEQFRRVLRDADVIDKRNRWIGGKTHLVQLGDLPDRGPDTRKAMDLLMKLQKQARRKGGHVHALIGNHEALNMLGDLRYVHPGEYEAFVDRGSARLQTAYYEASVEHLRKTLPAEDLPVFDEAFEQAFRERHPLGFVEHRRAWAPTGKYGRWVLENNTVIKINDTLFVHGGLSGKFAALSLDEINERVRAELAQPDVVSPEAIVDDSLGPLWYRGLAINDDRLEEERQRVTDMLSSRGAARIVVAHTPVTGAILPRFDARVIGVDVGLSAHYGARVACLVIEDDDTYVLHRGVRLDLPNDDEGRVAYLERAAELDPPPSPITTYIKNITEVGPVMEAEE